MIICQAVFEKFSENLSADDKMHRYAMNCAFLLLTTEF